MATENKNSEYFTLEEDSEVEEFVAADPNYKRKLFWYDLIEKTIRCVSIRELFIQALLSGFGFFLQLKLILFYISTEDYVGLAWTLTIAVLAGSANAVFFFFHRDPNAENKLLPRRLSSKLLPAVQVLRHVFCLGMISPIFNLFYYWLDIIKCKKELRQPLVLRSQPQPTKAEIHCVQKSLEGHLERSNFLLIETTLKFVPFALVQAFLYVHQELKLIDMESEPVNDQTDSNTSHQYGIRACTIFWNLLTLPLACTIYSNAHFHYTKSLQFQDLRDLGSSMNMTQVSGINSCFSFLNNFFSAAFRLYCITILVATVHYWTIAFILGFYLLFNFLVSIMPARSRFRYENPPNGMSTNASDMINRWINMFCCHAVKYECFIHFSYVFTVIYLVPRLIWISTEWSKLTSLNDTGNSNATESFTSKPETLQECLELEEHGHVILDVPILTTLIEYSFKFILLITGSCSQYLGLIQNDYGTFILFGIQYSLSLFYIVKAKSRIGFEAEFPVQIAYRFWARWLSRDWEFNDIFQMKKLILCVVLSDADVGLLAKNQRNWSAWLCPKIRKPVNSTEMEITTLWKLYEKKANGVIFLPSLERVEQILERRKTLRNSTECDVKLNLFLEFLTEHYVLEEDTLRILLYALENFDDIVSRSNSLRLSQLDLILK